MSGSTSTVAPENRPPGDSPKAIGASRSLRIGEVAELTGVTPRTIRYWEEIGLLEAGSEREQGKHRCYTEAEVQRIREIVRLRDLLNLSLEQLLQLVEAETARAALRREYHATDDPDSRRRILTELLGHIDTQLALVHQRRSEIEQLDDELTAKRALVRTRLAELD